MLFITASLRKSFFAAIVFGAVMAGADGKLVNISSRIVWTPETIQTTPIAGFVVGGGSSEVFVRNVGVSLCRFGVDCTKAGMAIRNASNTAWEPWIYNAPVALDPIASSVGAFALSNIITNLPNLGPVHANDAAALVTVSGSRTIALTGELSGKETLFELYQRNYASTSSKLMNLSLRSVVKQNKRMIGGFVIQGGTKTVLIRAMAGRLLLHPFYLPKVMSDPQLKLYRDIDGDGVADLIAENNNWAARPVAEIPLLKATASRVGAFDFSGENGSTGYFDAAILTTLGPGSYTVHVDNRETSPSTTYEGDVLMEIYDAD